MPKSSRYTKPIQYLSSLEKYGMKLGLKRIKPLLKSLGNPQDKLSIIHIGGTNGKGSTSAMIASILTEAGYRAGLYTSPHLVRFNERIKINGQEISDKKVAELVERIRQRLEARGLGLKSKTPVPSPQSLIPTFFEFATAMAFLYFAEEKVDFAIMEVGLGGRLDATNVGNPLVSVITNIARDHQAILGRRIKDIAFEKAGIIKKGGVLISGETKPAALKVLTAECKNKKAIFYRFDRDFFIDENTRVKAGALWARSRVKKENHFAFKGRRWFLSNLTLNLLGRHQYKNASCALAALEILQGKGFCIPESAVRKGFQNIFWPGRLEILRKKPLIVLDCAHNPAGAEVLREALVDLRKRKIISHIGHIRHIFLVLGIMADKDIKGILSRLAPLASIIILTRPKTERAAPLDILYRELIKCGMRIAGRPRSGRGIKNPKLKIKFINDVADACKAALSMSKADDMICITGSVFTVGEARDALLEMLQ
ncbi:MAG: bifunctional folylpolyglutamate synthase/dihydrofolate synthase [Deltaproteobacteria bacterium]|nr:bifunctional folylpolyglutamate synthase/dihydrofolate synthase [Deltaproteobacteria bacterium]